MDHFGDMAILSFRVLGGQKLSFHVVYMLPGGVCKLSTTVLQPEMHGLHGERFHVNVCKLLRAMPNLMGGVKCQQFWLMERLSLLMVYMIYVRV